MNTPEAYTERPVAVLWANHVWTLEAFARRVHPGNPLPIPAEVSKAVPLMPTQCRPCGSDSAPFSPPTSVASWQTPGGEPAGEHVTPLTSPCGSPRTNGGWN